MKNKKLFAILTLVCFMLTLMPVAAFAADADPATSGIVLKAGSDSDLRVSGETGTTTSVVQFKLQDNGQTPGAVIAGGDAIYVWAVDASGAKTSALNQPAECDSATNIAYVFPVKTASAVDDGTVTLSFARAGKYTVYAGVGKVGATSLSDITRFGTSIEFNVYSTAVSPDAYALTSITGEGIAAASVADKTIGTKTNYDATIKNVTPNNVAEEFTLTFKESAAANAKTLNGKTVTLQAGSANIVLDKETATTNILGQIKFKMSASREGVYSIYATIDGKTFEIGVQCGNTNAAYIETTKQPEKAIAQFTTLGSDAIRFTITDINGNTVKMPSTVVEAGQGLDQIAAKNAKYLFFTEKPAASAKQDGDLSLVYNSTEQVYNLRVAGTLDAEGTYAVKVILDNGAVATARWEVKQFLTPVSMYISAGVPAQVELGRKMIPTVSYVDANGTEKDATNEVSISATGYAIQSFDEGTKTIILKTDEKYVGSQVTVTAVSERYNLVCSSTATITEATGIAFEDKSLAVNVNNKIDWFIADNDGKMVRVNNVVGTAKTSYVVLDKPEGAKVAIYETKAFSNSEGQFSLTSDKVGNVTVQVVCQVTVKGYDPANGNGNGTANTTTNQTKYYTGTKIFAVGTEGVGDVVVMSIGSNEIIVNDAKATIDAAPIVQNDRTYVPFRALAEAFGAEVAYDEATQAVTAELNGVTVVMTIGSATYTVNGAEKTMDVAPFINGSRTMVPVRFVAEAFGIKVIPTYDENGATADILFNL